MQPKISHALQSITNDLINRERAKLERQVRETHEDNLRMQREIEKFKKIMEL
jgi:hypothetical protein